MKGDIPVHCTFFFSFFLEKCKMFGNISVILFEPVKILKYFLFLNLIWLEYFMDGLMVIYIMC